MAFQPPGSMGIDGGYIGVGASWIRGSFDFAARRLGRRMVERGNAGCPA